jgi:glycine/D-amino acid oxidase-like deaminating enzyme
MIEACGRPPWRVDVAIRETPLPAHADVAIVGAGLAGLATAYALVRRGVRPVVLEAGVGAGASGHSGAIALEGTAVGELEDADTCLESLARTTREAGIDCDLTLDGCWEVSHRTRSEAPEPRWRDGDATLAVTDTVPGGTIDAGAVLAGLARAVLDGGGSIHEHHRVGRIDVSTRRVLRTGHGARHERVVVRRTPRRRSCVPIDLRPALWLAVATVRSTAACAAIGLGRLRSTCL